MRVLVCGGRDYSDSNKVNHVLSEYLSEDLVIIQGDAKGADTLAKEWAKKRIVKCENYPADWDKYGKRAGFIRNVQMLNEGKPELIIAFPGGKGTQMMIKLAKSANVEVREID